MNIPAGISTAGLYIAFCAVIGFLLASVPNVELITLVIFFGGYIFGAGYGILIGGAAYFIYSAFNPWGSGLAFPPLLAAQVTAMMIVGGCGGLVYRILPTFSSKFARIILFGCCGFILTVLYHAALSVSTYQFAGFSLEQLKITLIAGLAFSAWHIVSNTIFFIILIPMLIRISGNFAVIAKIRSKKQ